MGIIYLIRCKLHNKVYVGQKTATLAERWYDHTQCAKRLLKHKQNPTAIADI
jgi:hypothetical protein